SEGPLAGRADGARRPPGGARPVTGPRGASLLGLLLLTGIALAGCSIPSWVPLIGSSKPLGRDAAPSLPARQATAPLISVTPAAGTTLDPDSVLDRVICVVNNDAITLFELDEAEAYYLYETKEAAPAGEARTALRDRLIQRIIENRLQLQQAEREKITVEDSEIAEQIADIMKKMNAKTEAELEQALRVQGVTPESVKKRIRDQAMVDRVRRRRVNLRVTVIEQEIDRYLEQNREKLETGLTFEARHILFIPDPNRGEDGWEEARRRAATAYERLLGGGDFGELAKELSQDGSGNDGGSLGTLKRGELAVEIESAILRLSPGESSSPFRSQVGYHLFRLDSKETLVGDGLTQARNQIRDILLREKLQVRLREWIAEIRQRAIIDMRL
ncbi:MAG TPA: peptidylprolyl isomerase, partial [Candidatus Binatia bacterium]|nr:peptidylprolyl isomerase [Candidatus Binatia bacterium]